jgi:WD40 repeat protein
VWITAWLLAIAATACAIAPVAAQDSATARTAVSEPLLVVDPGAHTAPIRQIAVDTAERTLVSVGDDKSTRVWDLASGRLIATLRTPAGAGDLGRLYAAAISIDGKLAIGGTTATAGGKHRIYLYDLASRAFERAIDARGGDVKRLQWSPDGRLLAAAYAGSPAVRLFDTTGNLVYEEVLPADAWSLAFSSRGALAVPVSDRSIRLYAITGGNVSREGAIATTLVDPRGVQFSPDGSLLAVGYLSRVDRRSVVVDVFDVTSRKLAQAFNFSDVPEGNLRNVAWQRDGTALYAGGTGYRGRNTFVIKRIAWPQGNASEIVAATNSVTDLLPLADGRVLYASAEPSWGELRGARAATLAAANSAQFYEADALAVDADGSSVAWQPRPGATRVHFDLRSRSVAGGSGNAIRLPLRSGIDILRWENEFRPSLGGTPIPMQPSEVSRAIAIAPDGATIYLGTSRTLRRLDRNGAARWSIAVPNEVRALNLSEDGRTLLAGMVDGTIVWRRAADGALLMTLFAAPDGRWVLWSERGYYDASAGAERLIGWLVNRANGEQADFFDISRFRDQYYRPDVIDRVLATGDETRAIASANDARRERAKSAEAAVRERVDRIIAAEPIAKILPPVVTLASPALVESNEPQVVVDYRLLDMDAERSTTISVRVDGRPHDHYDNQSPERRDGAAMGRLRIALPEKDSLIQILASNAHGASPPAEFEFRLLAPAMMPGAMPMLPPMPPQPPLATLPPEKPPSPSVIPAVPPTAAATPSRPPKRADRPNLYLLAIGVSKYANPQYNLALAAKDARDFAGVFNRQAGAFYRNVEARVLNDAQATRAAILDGLQWLQRITQEGDIGVLYVAGHGINDVDDTYYFLGHDASLDRLSRTAVPESAFRDALSSIRGKTIFFVDTCYSGKSVGTLSGTDLTRIANKLASPEYGVIVFAGSHGKQESLESLDWGNGAFTKVLISGVNGAADYRNQGVVTHRGLDYYVGYEVAKLTDGRQTPVTMVPIAVADFGVAARLPP